MEHEARGRLAFRRAIKRIPQYRMPKRQHMHPKLMRTTRFWAQFYARFLRAAVDHLPIGLCGAAGLMANHLPGPIRPIDDDWQINRAALRLHMPPDPGHIGLLRLAFFKLQPQMTLGMGLQRKNHDARGISIQPMHQKRRGIIGLNAGDQTISQKRSTPRHRQKTRRLVDHQ